MGAGFGVRRCGPLLGTGAWALALPFVITGCSGDALLVGEERPRAEPGADDLEGPGGIGPAVPPVDVALVSDCPPSPEERRALVGCWPTHHLGSWRGFFIGVPRYETIDGAGAEFPAGDVLLELGVSGAAQLRFGVPPEGSVARDPEGSLCGPREVAPGCPAPGHVLAGFAYQLAELELFDPMLAPAARIAGEPPLQLAESMTFVVRVSEPWDTWCAREGPERELSCAGGDCPAGDWFPPPGAAIDAAASAAADGRGCLCDDSSCRSDAPSVSLSISLQMSADGNALRGSYTPNDARIGQARLEFRKDSDP